MTLSRIISAFLAETGMAATRFGRECCNDAGLVPGIRGGRIVGKKLETRILTWIKEYREQNNV